MVKSKAKAEEKMRDRVSTAGKYLKEGLDEAPNPIDILLKDYDAKAKALLAGLAESIRTGKHKIGLEVAKKRGSWAASHDRAASHFEERTEDMVTHAMEDYDVRAGCIEKAKAAIAGMVKTTRANRIARSAKYQEEMGKCMDAAKGRKA